MVSFVVETRNIRKSLFLPKHFFSTLEIVGQTSQFSQKIWKYYRKSAFWSKIAIFTKNLYFAQKFLF